MVDDSVFTPGEPQRFVGGPVLTTRGASEISDRIWLVILYLPQGEPQRFVGDPVLSTRGASEVSERIWWVILHLPQGEPQRSQIGCG